MKNVDLIYPELSYKVTGILFEVHNILGRFCTERQFCDLIESKFKDNKINYVREKNINEEIAGDRVDFCIEDKIILECKAKKFVTKEDYWAVQRYLQNSGRKLCLLVNFRNTYIRPKRIVRIETN